MSPHRSLAGLTRGLAPFVVCAALASTSTPAHGGWSADPVQVHATSNSCPLVAACGDGAHGAIAVWQEVSSGTVGVVYARHLLPSGDLDPAWSAPATVCATANTREALGAVADRQGGAYVWWMEGASLYVTRIAADGSLAAGWAARGRPIGMLLSSKHRPIAFADGTGGLYLGWLQTTLTADGLLTLPGLRAAHLGPANTGTGGWSNGARTLGTTPDAYEWVIAGSIGLAPDGGLWVAWATALAADDGAGGATLSPGDWRLTRVGPNGIPASGWLAHGISVGTFHGELLDPVASAYNWSPDPQMSLVAVAADGAGGAFYERADLVPGGGAQISTTLHRYGPDGAVAAGWTAAGNWVWQIGIPPNFDAGDVGSLRLEMDGTGGVFAGQLGTFSEGLLAYGFAHVSAAGTSLPGAVGASVQLVGLDEFARPDGGVFIASFNPSGPSSIWSPNAYISAQGSSGGGYLESHDQPVQTWYGDVALASSEDGGAFFFWSQSNQRFGVFAVRLGPAGLVTGVPPASVAAPRLALRFAAGQGVRARVWLPAGRSGSLTLCDVAGRVVASAPLPIADGREWTVPGTAGVAPGVYFARVPSGAMTLRTKLAITR